MRLNWSSNKWALSRMIRWAFNQPVSHFSICFDKRVVIHSNLFGVGIKWAKTFEKENEIVIWREYELTLEQEEDVYQKLIAIDQSRYDWGAFFYFAWRALLFKLFKTPIPPKNPWGNDRAMLCTEIASVLPDFILPDKSGLDIVTPYDLYLRVR